MVTNISTLYINATKEKVWQTITAPASVKLWQFGSDLITDWNPGNDIRFRTAWEENIFEQWGTVIEYKENESLIYSLFAPRPGLEDKPENYFTMTYRVTEEGGQTKLQIIQEDNRANAVQEAPQGEENPVLAELKRIAEGK